MAMYGVPPGITNPPRPVEERQAGEAGATDAHEAEKTPGTLILVFVFLAAFVVYYFVNWKLLSVLWRIG
jgi:hypothetical protein